MICYILLNYKTYEMTLSCVKNIKMQEGKKKIIIVDNFSDDGSGKRLVKKFKNDDEVKIILATKNLGFAKGNNLGYSFAKTLRPDAIIIMNNDMEIKVKNIQEIINNVYKNNRFDILGPKIYSVKYDYFQNPQRKSNYTLTDLKKMRASFYIKNKMKFIFYIKWRVLGFYFNKKQLSKKQSIELDNTENVPLHGSFYVFSKDFINRKDKAFYEGTFMYMESYILHYQAIKDGMKMIYCPDILVDHYEDVTTDKVYRDGYKKAVFTNKCMLDSVNAYINLFEENNHE